MTRPDLARAELAELLALPLRREIAGRTVELRPVRFSEFVAITSADSEPERLAAALLALTCSEPIEWWSQLEGDDQVALGDMLQIVNRALYAPPKPARSKSADADGGWVDAVAQLLAAGHRLPEVMQYTFNQIDLFLRAANRATADRRLDDLSLLRAAQSKTADFRRFVADLRRARRQA